MKGNARGEVLAPAGGFDSMAAAVRCGADAVYFGAGAFNARIRAAGFGPEDIARAAAYCRARNVKTYLTLNTLVYDHELEAAMALVKAACGAGVDALILQDLGLIRQIRKQAPDMTLHASTQMTAHTPSGLRFLHKMGFSRAVLARELSRAELAELLEEAARLGMETEVFVHGALCMSVSGQCSLSAALGGRSGNRGECAQPCRLPFSAPGREYALSLKDLCLLDHIPELLGMGVDSLKIEGRLKRPEYVAAATAAYRNAADGREVVPELRRNLRDIFSRGGFTDGYYTAKRGASMFGVRSREDKDASGAAVSAIHELYRRERAAVPADMILTVLPGEPLRLDVTDGARRVTEEGPAPLAAQGQPLDLERARAQLEKTGGTPFFLRGLRTEIAPGLHAPGSVLAALRRQALERLLRLREEPSPVPFFSDPPPPASGSPLLPDPAPEIWAEFRDPAAYSPEMGLARFFVPWNSPDAFFGGHASRADTRRADKPVCGVSLPRGMFGADTALQDRLRALHALGIRDALCGNIGAAQLALEAGMRPHFGPGMNLFGERALLSAREQGAASGILSPEVPAAQAVRAARAARAAGVAGVAGANDGGISSGCIPAGAAAYGHLPLMLARNCPLRSGSTECAGCGTAPRCGRGVLTDRTGRQLPVACSGGCAEVFNPHVLWMADRLADFRGLDFILLYFTDESPRRCAEVARAYREGGPPPAAFTRLG